MSWSAAGNVASYPAYQPTTSGASSGSFTFRLSPDVGIVYVTGAINIGTAGAAGVLTLPAAFRPLSAVSIPTNTSGAAMGITPGGVVNFTGTGANGTYAVRSFYFTTVTPA